MVLSSPQHLGAASMFGKPGANVLRSPSRDPLGAQPGGGLGGLAGAGAGMFSGAVSRGPGRVQDDPLVGKRVKVCKGPYKGCVGVACLCLCAPPPLSFVAQTRACFDCLAAVKPAATRHRQLTLTASDASASQTQRRYKGIVMAATRQIVRLELEANEKTVTVNRTDLDGQEVRPADVLGLVRGDSPTLHPLCPPGISVSFLSFTMPESIGPTPHARCHRVSHLLRVR